MARKLKLQQKILLGYALPIIALLIATVWGAWSAQTVIEEFQKVNLVANLVDKTHHLELAHLQMSNGTRGYLLNPDRTFVERKRRGQAFFEDTVTLLNREDLSLAYLGRYFPASQMGELTEFKEQLDTITQRIENYEDRSTQMVALRQSGQLEAANELFAQQSGEEIEAQFATLNQNLHKIYAGLVLEGQDITEQSLRQLVQGLVVIALGVGGLSGLALWWVASRLAQSINQTASQIIQSTHEIMATVEQQTATAAAQASAVNQTTATMAELERSAQVSADQAQKASQSAKQALNLTDKGNAAVEETLSGMQTLQTKVEVIAAQAKRLSTQNQQIGTISQLVSALSNQTNVLALNAAVEAVRAGEAGKGFSVVAGEIRGLADESKQSAGRINNLVAEIQTMVNSTVTATQEGTETVTSGTSLVQDTAQVFAGVQAVVNEVVMSNQQIALNVQQQMQAVQQVVGAMTSLNQGAQETAQGTQQTQYEIRQLDRSARNLQALV